MLRRFLPLMVALPVVVMAGLAALLVWGPRLSAQQAATIALPPPGATEVLYDGCNNIALTFPDGTPSQTVVDALDPPGAVQAMWRYDAYLKKFEGFSPAAPQASDLLSVDFLDAVWICVTGEPTPTPTAPPPVPTATAVPTVEPTATDVPPPTPTNTP